MTISHSMPVAPCGTVLVADDHAVFREGLRLLMQARGFATTVLEAGDAVSAEAMVRSNPAIELVVLDLYMPGMEDLSLLRRILTLRPELAVAVLTASEKRHDLRAVQEAGASGYIPKSFTITDILAALTGVLDGEPFFPTEALPHDATPALEAVSLSPRQREVLCLVAQGLSNKEIARRLDTALPTVKNHMAAILERLGTQNRVGAVHLARKIGLIPDA